MNLYQYITTHEEHKNLFIKAQGGSGKTTQLRFIESKLIERAKKGEKIAPVYIDVKNIDSERANPIYNEIHTYFGTGCDVDDVKDAFEKAQTDYFNSYKLYILIDALNETVSPKAKARIIEDTNSLCKCSNCTVIVTSRVIEEGLTNGFQNLELQPIDEKNVFDTIERKYAISNHIQPEKVNQSLIKILQTPLFLMTYLKAFPNEEDYSRLYDPKTARKGQILDAYRNKILEDLDLENRRSIEYRNKTTFLINNYLPAISFKISLLGKFSISDKEIKELRKKLTTNYFANFVDEDETGFIDDYLNNPFSIIIKHFAIIEKHGKRPDTVYSIHNIWRDYFAALHVVNILHVGEDCFELEERLDENTRQFVGELYKNKDGLCECDFESKCKCDDENMSPIELFMQEKTLNENVVKNLINIMITARHYKITGRFHNLDLKNVRFDNCTLPYSSFDNSKIYADNFLSEGHAGYVYDVKVIDADTVISSGKDGTVKLWNYKTGKLKKSVKIHSDYASSLALCHDKQSIISGGYDNISIKLDVKTLSPIGEPFCGHTDRINCVAVSSDDKYVTSASDDTDVLVFDNTNHSHSVVTKISQHSASVNCVTFSQDNRFIVSGDSLGIINVFDLKTHKSIASDLEESLRQLYEIISNEEKSESSDDILNHYNIRLDFHMQTSVFKSFKSFKLSELPIMKRCAIKSIATYNDLIITGHQNGAIIFWRLLLTERKLKVEFLISPHKSSVESIVVFKDTLISAGYEGNIHFFDLKNRCNSVLIQEAHNDWINSLSVSSDGVLFTAGGDQRIKMFDIESLNECYLPLFGANGWTNALAFDSMHNYLFSGGDDSRLRVFDLKKRTLAFIPQEIHRARINALSISIDGKSIIAAGDDGTIKKFSTDNSNLLCETTDYNDNWVRSLAITPDLEYVVAGKWSGDLGIYDYTTLKQVGDVNKKLHKCSVEAICVSRNSKLIFSASDDKTIRVSYRSSGYHSYQQLYPHLSKHWSPYKGLRTINTEHTDRIRALALSKNETELFSAGWDGKLIKYSIKTFKKIKSVKAHKARIDALCILNKKRLIITGSDDGSLKVFDNELNEIKTIKTNKLTCISTICVSEDEQYIYAAGESGIISIIDTKTLNVVESITQLDINIFGTDFSKIRGENIDNDFYKILRENGAII